MIFNIQRFSTHDGPGIRTIVFLKGCPLHCAWCENPESQSPDPELMYDSRFCIGCLECVNAAQNGEIVCDSTGDSEEYADVRPVVDRERVLFASALRNVCPTGALSVTGEEREIADIVGEVEKDLAFYGETGGVTISGGEPYMQPRFTLDLMRALHGRGLDIAVETSLQASWTAIEPTVPLVSVFLADVKHADVEKYRLATGGDLNVVMRNFRKLESLGVTVIARIPVVPGFNDDAQAMHAILLFVSSLSNVKEVNFLPYHTLGNGKYGLLGRESGMKRVSSPPAELVDRYLETALGLGLQASIGG
ncbi:MAG TPA: glycyl-radical enzyme activating protein [Spirochaetia bacterium]|nr:glycyl-radical enzyme activating protein [Spirochaetia bacterium]